MIDFREGYSIDDWIEAWGRPYYGITNRIYVTHCCANEIISGEDRADYQCQLPQGWRAVKDERVGRGMWYIFRIPDVPLITKKQINFEKRSNREKQILDLKEQKIPQKDIAKMLGITPAAVSKVLKRIAKREESQETIKTQQKVAKPEKLKNGKPASKGRLSVKK